MLRIIDRYVMRHVLGVMLATIATGVLVLCLARMLIVVQSGASFAHNFPLVMKLTVLFVPHYLGFMLPLSLFWASYTVVRRLSLNAELTTLLASGVSLTRFTLPLLLMGVIVTVGNAGILGWAEPWGRYLYREIEFQVENVSPYLAATEGEFIKVGGQTLLVEHIDQSAGTFSKIFLYEPKTGGGSTEILAESGNILVDGGRVALLLRNGTQLKLKPQGTGREPAPESLDFETMIFPLSSTEKPFRAMGDDEQEYSLLGLYRLADTPPAGTSPAEMISELHRKLVIILSSLFLPLLATAFARTNARGRNAVQGVISFTFLIAYYQVVQFGSILTNMGLSPALTVWPVFLLLLVAALSLLAVQDLRAGTPVERVVFAINSVMENVVTWFRPAPPRRRRRRLPRRRRSSNAI
ncbi:LptF/LptG family permease [Aestuariivirga sp.]|uniref:LptF/LptG family permease n=1 Tax=Aestuariivirga sp. TaxID=2650926 RepID=UPI0039E376BF